MTKRATACVLFAALGTSLAVAVAAQSEPIPRGTPPTIYVTVTERALYQGRGPY